MAGMSMSCCCCRDGKDCVDEAADEFDDFSVSRFGISDDVVGVYEVLDIVEEDEDGPSEYSC